MQPSFNFGNQRRSFFRSTKAIHMELGRVHLASWISGISVVIICHALYSYVTGKDPQWWLNLFLLRSVNILGAVKSRLQISHRRRQISRNAIYSTERFAIWFFNSHYLQNLRLRLCGQFKSIEFGCTSHESYFHPSPLQQNHQTMSKISFDSNSPGSQIEMCPIPECSARNSTFIHVHRKT